MGKVSGRLSSAEHVVVGSVSFLDVADLSGIGDLRSGGVRGQEALAQRGQRAWSD